MCRHKKDIPYTITTIYGNETIDESVLQELIECPSVQRLKNIHQYGVIYYAWKAQEFSRYTHSIGVMVLLRRFGASLNEQIAGLLHDVSHTIFSHLGDHMFKQHSEKNSYQDDIHRWYIQQTEIPKILTHYGISVDDILHKNGKFKMLEQDLPDVCCDRLEYNLYGGLIEDLLTIPDIHRILNHVSYENGQWLFTDRIYAKQYANISLYLTKNNFASAWNQMTNEWMAQALHRALDLNAIDMRDIHFSVDDTVWDLLIKSDDAIIKNCMYKIMHHKKFYRLSDETDYDLCIHPKFYKKYDEGT